MNLKANSYKLRQDILDIVYHAKGGHIGGDMSVIDTLNVLYNKQMNVTPENFHDPDHDRFILSKGHTVEALYAVLCQKGFFPREDLKTVSQYLSKYIGHPNNKVNGIEMNSGSLGHGLSVAIGMALAGKMDKRDYRVYVVMGDGELAEGSVWEGAMAGGHYKLDNLTIIIDNNGLQIDGTNDEVMSLGDLPAKLRAFGFDLYEIDGHDLDAIEAALSAPVTAGKPKAILAHTVKGKGISFMENQVGWHGKAPNDEQYQQAMRELEEGI